MNRKSLIALLISIVLLSAFSMSCAAQKDGPAQPESALPEVKQNVLFPYAFQGDEYKLASLLSLGTETHIFEFKVSEDYKTIRMWCDAYQNGEAIFQSPTLKRKISDSQGTEGMIAVIWDGKSMKLNMRTVSSGSSKGSSNTFELANDQTAGEDGSFWQKSSGLVKAVTIEKNKEIKLFVYASDTDVSTLPPPQYFIDNPDQISQYDYCCIVTCVFSQ